MSPPRADRDGLDARGVKAARGAFQVVGRMDDGYGNPRRTRRDDLLVALLPAVAKHADDLREQFGVLAALLEQSLNVDLGR